MDLEGLVEPVVASAGLELVEVSFAREQGQRILRVTVDRDGGVDLDAIAEVSEKVSRRLDLEGFSPGPYSLEVSSPGVERPLRAPDEFASRVGERIRVRTQGEERRTLEGTILGADARHVTVATEGGEVQVAFESIASARTVFEWGQPHKGGGS
ncbi:MAG TPA: ribosome maturation factor RimP [Actinomycetota bacterium]|jgi:ribosome maturation factor RimP